MKNVITYCGFLPHDTRWNDRLVYVTEHQGKTCVVRQWPTELAHLMEGRRPHAWKEAWTCASWAPIDEMESIDAKAAALARDTRDVMDIPF